MINYLIVAILFLLSGHIMRMLRTVYILRLYVNEPIKPYLRSLSIGYLVDFIFPFRISDIVRTFIFSRMTLTSWRMSLSLSFIERVFDLIIIFFMMYFFNVKSYLTLFLFVFSLIVYLFCNTLFLKRTYYFLASFFNDFIKNFFLGLYWSLFRLKINMISNFKVFFIFSILSLFMWLFYILSTLFLSFVIKNESMKDLILYLYTGIKSSGIWNSIFFFRNIELLYYIVYLILPVFLMFLMSVFPFYLEKNAKTKLKMIPFISNEDSLTFFDYFFNNNFSIEDELYYNMVNNSIVLKDLSAASEAKTYLMQDKSKLFIRKVALSNASFKLKDQYRWIVENSDLPLPKIISCYDRENIFSYDMEYFANGETFFTTIHHISVDDSWSILKEILYKLSKHYNNTFVDKKIVKDTVLKIYEEHINNNIDFISSNRQIKELANFKEFIVNNETVPNILTMKDTLKDFHFSLKHNIKYIHGDLTIENILVDMNKNYIIIDPAPRYNNIFAEYSKLFQSLHGKYEYVKNTPSWSIEKNIITYANYSTVQYEKIFNYLSHYILDNYGTYALKAIYFYEAICYIRALGYMIKINKENAVLMLALAGIAIKEWHKL